MNEYVIGMFLGCAIAAVFSLQSIASNLKKIHENMISYSSWYQLLKHFSEMQKGNQ